MYNWRPRETRTLSSTAQHSEYVENLTKKGRKEWGRERHPVSNRQEPSYIVQRLLDNLIFQMLLDRI